MFDYQCVILTQKGPPKCSSGSIMGSLSVLKELFPQDNTIKYKQKRKPQRSNKVCKSWMLHTGNAQEGVLQGALPWRLKDSSKNAIRSKNEVLEASRTNPWLPQKLGQVEICPCFLPKQSGTGQDESGTGSRSGAGATRRYHLHRSCSPRSNQPRKKRI